MLHNCCKRFFTIVKIVFLVLLIQLSVAGGLWKGAAVGAASGLGTENPDTTQDPAVSMAPQETITPGQAVQTEEPLIPGAEDPAVETEMPAELMPTVTPAKTPTPKPFAVQLRQRNHKIQLSWKKVSGAASYQIYLKQSGKSFRKYKQTKKRKILIKYSAGKEYRIKIVAYGKKHRYINTSQTYRFYIPKQSSRIHIVYRNSKEATLRWKQVPRAAYYQIYQKRGKGSAKLIKQTKKCEYTIRSLASGNSYQFQIQAVYRQGKQKFVGRAAKCSYDNHQIVSTDHQKYTYNEMASDIAQLSRKYPGVVHYSVIGKSEDGRNIYDVSVGNRSASRSVLVVSTLHAREYMASLVCMKQIEYYARNYQEELEGKRVGSVFSCTCVHYIPMANPDGVSISQYGISQIHNKKLQKKLKKLAKGTDTKLWKANAAGVDLNNNFPYQFEVRGTAGGQGYSGARSACAKETQAIMKRIKALKGNHLKAVINYHAMGSIIYGDSDAGVSGSVAANTARMYATAREVTGYTSAGVGSSSGSGSLREYIMYDLHLPSITLEVGRRTCPGPITEFSRIWKENANLILREAMLF